MAGDNRISIEAFGIARAEQAKVRRSRAINRFVPLFEYSA